jgi:hypothetical protein
LDCYRMAGDDGRCGAERVSGGGGGAAERRNAEEVFASGFAGGWIGGVVLLAGVGLRVLAGIFCW